MAKHRSLSSALLTPEKMAFIQGKDRTPIENSSVALPPEQSDGANADIASEISTEYPQPQPLKKTGSRRVQAASTDSNVSAAPLPANETYLVAVTTRLQAPTAEALRRAHLEQKLNRREPATQQEIIEAAVQYWLRQHKFLH